MGEHKVFMTNKSTQRLSKQEKPPEKQEDYIKNQSPYKTHSGQSEENKRILKEHRMNE